MIENVIPEKYREVLMDWLTGDPSIYYQCIDGQWHKMQNGQQYKENHR